MATGIGKTRLMGACIYYLYKTKGYKHFFILAPGNTIYDKLRKESNPAHPKYIFKGLEAEMGRPRVWDGETYDQYPVRYEQGSLFVDQMSEIQIFIFNIGKIFNSKTTRSSTSTSSRRRSVHLSQMCWRGSTTLSSAWTRHTITMRRHQ